MAKKSSIEKEQRRRRTVAKYADKRKQLKDIIKNFNSPEEEKALAMVNLNKMPRNSAPCRLRNRCQLTGRARGFLRHFQMSRLSFRELASMGMIPGIVKASW
jgi:small subunit ribosomal protein S14